MAKAGLGAAALWTTPVVLTLSASPALGSPIVPPAFVAGSVATAFDGPSVSGKSITLTSPNVQVGDLWMAILAYHFSGTINTPSGAGWNASTVVAANGGGSNLYSVRSVVIWRVLTASDISGGSFSQTFTASGSDLTYGGFRGAAVAYRGTALVANVTANGTSQGPGFGSSAGVTFPAASPPGASPNVVVRLGAARGYGGYLAGQNINWTSFPGTGRVNYNANNTGDRAVAISEQPNDAGAAAGGSYYTATFGARNRTTFTAVVRNGP